MTTPLGAGRLRGACAAAAVLALAACGGSGTDSAAPDVQASATESAAHAHDVSAQTFGFHIQRFTIKTLGNRADLISNGDALVEVQVPSKLPLDRVKVTLNGKNVSAAFATVDASKRTLRGLVTGLKVGDNLLRVDADTRRSDSVGLAARRGRRRQPRHHQPPARRPGDLGLADAAVGLRHAGASAGQRQHAGVERQRHDDHRGRRGLQHRHRIQAVLPQHHGRLLHRPARPEPAGSAAHQQLLQALHAGHDTGRSGHHHHDARSHGAVHRARRARHLEPRHLRHRGAVRPEQAWSAVAPQAQWNGKIVHSFGASTGHTRLQNRSTQNWSDHQALSRGFMVVDHSLTDSINNSNRVLVAETVMMLKELITDGYGEIKYLMGNGCSGGSIQQNTVASIFPGLLDGLQPSCTYPDSITTGMEVGDCVLLVNFYDGPEWKALMAGKTQAEINAKKTAINGHLDHVGCQSWNNAFGFANQPGNFVRKLVLDTNTGAMGVIPGELPRNNCNLPAALVYDPVTNPTGVRCSDPDNAQSVWGTDAQRDRRQRRARAADRRQRRHPVRARRAEVRRDHGRGVRAAQRAHRRHRRRLQAPAPAHDGRPRRAAHRLPRGRRVQWRAPRARADPRLARLRRVGHPLHLAHLRRARAHRAGQPRQLRQPGDLALRHRAAAGHGGAGQRR